MALWTKLTYARRLFLWLLVYSLLLVGCFALFQYDREKEFKAVELNSRLQFVNKYISGELAAGRDIADINFADLQPFDDIRLSVIDSSGHVVYDNSLDRIPDSNHLNRKEIAEAIKNGSGYTVRRHSESTGDTYFYSATRGADGTTVRTAVPYSLSLSHVLSADYTFLWIMGGITVLFCIFGYFATRRVGLHISRLSAFAADAERGEKITDIEPFPHDELGDISNHIVRLYARLQQAITDRDREHASAMHQQKEKDRIKKQLTNNINHELKTPVSSIQLCVETMLAHEDMDGGKRREFLERCLANVGRLKKLLGDVALITRMDDGGNMISREPLDLAEIIDEAVSETVPLAEAKGMRIKNHVTGKIPVTGNSPLLASVFVNLIDNAIAYSGASVISVDAAVEDGRQVKIKVADNGCGVGAEHLPHLFERFYRVDKGRSRASGGTGLGLSIVKNAVALHRGNVSVSNRLSGGLEFVIILPLTVS